MLIYLYKLKGFNYMQNKVGLIIFSIFVMGSVFYWFVYRPNTIRKECNNKAVEQSVMLYPPYKVPDTAKRALLQSELEASVYKSCISGNGLAE